MMYEKEYSQDSKRAYERYTTERPTSCLPQFCLQHPAQYPMEYPSTYQSQLGMPEVEDCSSAIVPDTSEPGKGKKKVIVSDPASMTKYLFDNYRLSMYTFLNKCRRDGTISELIGARVHNGTFNREAVRFPNVAYRRIDRENCYADVFVEIKLETENGRVEWNGVIEIWCSFETEELKISFEGLKDADEWEKTDLMSPFLVPYFTNRRMDTIAEYLWLKYIPEALKDPKARKAVELAKRMGLNVEYHDIYEHHGVKGIIFFAEDELLVGDDRYEYDQEGKLHLVKTGDPKKVKIPANTIVINTNKVKRDYSEFHIFHECIHYEFHYLFFRLQQMGNNDPRRMKTKVVIVDKDEEVKDEMYFIEKQANRGAYGLMMPASNTRELICSEAGKVKQYRHSGDKYEQVGKALGRMLHLPHFHIRARMIQLGYIEAKGSLNYAEKKLIRPFAFDIDSWRESDHTYVIEQSVALGLCRINDDLKRLMDSGDYVYAEGHVIRNDPKFVAKEGDRYILTDLANGHVDECCLRFVRQYKQENIGQYVYGRMYFDADYLKQTRFYLSDIMNSSQVDEFEAKKKYKEDFPMEFIDVVERLRKKNKISIEKLADILSMDKETLRRWLVEPKKYRNEDFLTLLILIFKLPDWISNLLLKRAHFQFDEDDKRHDALLRIIRVQSEDGIEAANEYLKERNLEPLSVDSSK